MWETFSQTLTSAPGDLWRLLQSGWLPWLILLAVIAVLIIVWLLRLAADKPLAESAKNERSGSHRSPLTFLKRVMRAFRELLTPREWCYRQPWYLFVGVGNSHKHILLAALSGEAKPYITLKEEKLSGSGGKWRFFNSGALIDVQGETPDDTSGGRQQSLRAEPVVDWKSLIERIQRFRPERPLDGIIVNLSAEEILSDDKLISRLDSLRAALWQIQETSAFAFPVYLVINNCQQIPGFTAFSSALPDSQQQQIFGWSYTGLADERLNKRLLEAGMAEMRRTLKHKILQLAASDSEIEDIDALLLFPHRFAKLQQRVPHIVGALFRDTDPQARLLMRGVYFSGQPDTRPGASFAVDLFSRKIFSEANLAYPTRQGVLSQNRALRRYQWASGALFAALTTWMIYDWHSLEAQLQTIDHSLHAMRRLEQSPHQEHLVYALITEMANMNAGSLARATIPASWGGIDHHISDYLADKHFQPFIFPALQDQLIRKGHALARYEPVISVRHQVTDITDLTLWLENLADFTLALQRFHQLSQGENLDSETDVLGRFSRLMEYTFERPMPPEFKQHSELYAIALREVCYPQNASGVCAGDNAALKSFLADFESKVSQRLLGVAEAAQLSFAEHESYQGKLFETLQLVEVNASPELVRKLPALLLEFASWYDSVAERWLPERGNDPCAALAEDLRLFKTQHQLSSSNHRTLDHALNIFSPSSCREPAIQSLHTASYPQIGNLLHMAENNRLAFTAEAQSLRGAIKTLEKLPFFTVASATTPPFLGDEYYWDSTQLAKVHEHFAAYEEYAASHTGRSSYQMVAMTAARALLHNALQTTVASSRLTKTDVLNAQSGPSAGARPLSMSQRDLQTQVNHLKAAASSLAKLPALYIQIGQPESARELSQTTKRYSLRLLQRIDELAESAQLYQPRQFASIDQSSMAATLFGLGSLPLVKDYLFNQSQTVKNITLNMALPVLDFIAATQQSGYSPLSYREQQLFSKWRETAVEIDKSEISNPDNNKQRLEDFFTGELVQLSPHNCLRSLPPQYMASGLDIFASARQHIIEQLRYTCTSDNLAELKAGYRRLATTFNRDLAGKFPFGDASSAVSAEAAFAEVHNFFSLYESDYRSVTKQLLAASEGQAQYTELRRFLNELENAADFFSDNLTRAQQFDQSSIEVGVRFRALDREGFESSEIVSWQLAFGNQTLTSPGVEQTAFWRFGTPVRLTLRWAEEATTRPTPTAADALRRGQEPRIADRSAVFESSGNWALLRMVQQQRSALRDPLLPATSPEVVLGFSVSQRNTADQTALMPSDVYLRMALYATAADSGRKYLLKVPTRFPSAAPSI